METNAKYVSVIVRAWLYVEKKKKDQYGKV